MKEDYIVCRCEDVTLSALMEARAAGALTARQLKLATRAGMGFCQGRTCRPFLEALAGGPDAGAAPAAPGALHRPPARPVSFGALAGEVAE